MAERTNELADALRFIADGGELLPGDPELLREAADALRSMPKEQKVVDYPHDITTRWLEHISNIKHSARATGKTSPIHNLTSVESILKWWEEEIRPELIHREDNDE